MKEKIDLNFYLDYKQELTTFYKPFFNNEKKLECFVDKAVDYDEKAYTVRNMIQQVERFVSLANDVDKIRPSRDPLRMLFIKVCLESLAKLSNYGMKKFSDEFEKCFSDLGKEYILENFKFIGIDTPKNLSEKEKLFFDKHEDYALTISDFLEIIRVTRNTLVHEGDYWSMQFFTLNSEFKYLVNLKTRYKPIKSFDNIDNNTQYTYCFDTTMQYDKFIYYFVEACVKYVTNYIEFQEQFEV